MRIYPPKVRTTRQEPVRFGKDSIGKRRLVSAVMDAGYDKQTALKAVDAVLAAWRKAIRRGDRSLPAPGGRFRIHTTPKHLRGKIIALRIDGKLSVRRLYQDQYRILWRLDPEVFADLLQVLNQDGENPH